MKRPIYKRDHSPDYVIQMLNEYVDYLENENEHKKELKNIIVIMVEREDKAIRYLKHMAFNNRSLESDCNKLIKILNTTT